MAVDLDVAKQNIAKFEVKIKKNSFDLKPIDEIINDEQAVANVKKH